VLARIEHRIQRLNACESLQYLPSKLVCHADSQHV
jgi:hypothetical protein